MKFGERLRIERKKNNLFAGELATACGISRSYVTLIENGKRLPGKKIIVKIAEALKLKPDLVLNWYLKDVKNKMQKSLDIETEN